MDTFIFVNGNDRVVKASARNGIISEHTLRAAFLLEDSLPICLSQNEIVLERRRNKENDYYFILPDEWNGSQFELRWDESRRTRAVRTPRHSDRRPDNLTLSKIEKEKIDKIIEKWEDRVFCIEGENGLQVSGVLISDRRILTSSHINLKLNDTYNVRGTKNRCENVICEFISKKYEFAILKSTTLPDYGTTIDQLGQGHEFIIMGYPSGISTLKPSVSKVIIDGFMKDQIHHAGSPGPETGCHGAPVFDKFGYLTGILIGATNGLNVHSTISHWLVSPAEQTYSQILGYSCIISLYRDGQSDTES